MHFDISQHKSSRCPCRDCVALLCRLDTKWENPAPVTRKFKVELLILLLHAGPAGATACTCWHQPFAHIGDFCGCVAAYGL